MARLSPQSIWLRSTRAYRRGHRTSARVLKSFNYLLYRAILPYECTVADDVRFLHRAMNVVVHPATVIGRGVVIAHGVTIAAGSDAASRVVIGDHVFLGANCSVAAGAGRTVTVGDGCQIGIGAVVTRDLQPNTRVRAPWPSTTRVSTRATSAPTRHRD
jgi:serine acetyltransferase